jgi:hypothetical protein
MQGFDRHQFGGPQMMCFGFHTQTVGQTAAGQKTFGRSCAPVCAPTGLTELPAGALAGSVGGDKP